MFIAEVMAVNVDESLLDEKGTLHLSDADLIAYSHGRYYGLGDFIGKFGYSVQKPSKPKSSRKKKIGFTNKISCVSINVTKLLQRYYKKITIY